MLAHGIAEGQHFLDGNKRTALVAMLTFLEINGLRVKASDHELAICQSSVQAAYNTKGRARSGRCSIHDSPRQGVGADHGQSDSLAIACFSLCVKADMKRLVKPLWVT